MGALSSGATAAVGKMLGKRVEEENDLAYKHLALFQMMNQWVKVKQAGKNLSSYFEQEDKVDCPIISLEDILYQV